MIEKLDILQMDAKEKVTNYFKTFSNQDLNGLANFLADNVELTDWETHAQGRERVLAANAVIFNNVTSINITPLHIYVDGAVAACEILVTVNADTVLKVVDIIEFNADGLICSIRAYKS